MYNRGVQNQIKLTINKKLIKKILICIKINGYWFDFYFIFQIAQYGWFMV